MYNEDDRLNEIIETRIIEEAKALEEEKAFNKQMEAPKRPRRYMASILVTAVVAVGAFSLGGAVFSGQLFDKHEQLTVATSSPKPDTESAVQTAVKNSTNNGEVSVVDVANIAADTVVEITTEVMTTGQIMQQYISEGAGSGVILTSDGYIVTNNHVIDGANKITVRLRNGESYEAKLIGTDAQTDLAVIKIEATNLKVATLGDSDALQVGELAVAIGNPLGQLGGTVTDGIISALDREITIEGQTRNLLQTSAAINPGNSGGGLFNEEGQLIGIVVAKSSGYDIEGIGFAIPANDVKTVAEQLMNHGYVQGRPVLGVSIVDISSVQAAMQYGLNQTGVYVAGLTEGTHSEAAGLQVGDYLIAIDGTQIRTSSDISSALQNYSVGDKVSVTASREGKLVTIDLELAESKPTK